MAESDTLGWFQAGAGIANQWAQRAYQQQQFKAMQAEQAMKDRETIARANLLTQESDKIKSEMAQKISDDADAKAAGNMFVEEQHNNLRAIDNNGEFVMSDQEARDKAMQKTMDALALKNPAVAQKVGQSMLLMQQSKLAQRRADEVDPIAKSLINERISKTENINQKTGNIVSQSDLSKIVPKALPGPDGNPVAFVVPGRDGQPHYIPAHNTGKIEQGEINGIPYARLGGQLKWAINPNTKGELTRLGKQQSDVETAMRDLRVSNKTDKKSKDQMAAYQKELDAIEAKKKSLFDKVPGNPAPTGAGENDLMPSDSPSNQPSVEARPANIPANWVRAKDKKSGLPGWVSPDLANSGDYEVIGK